MLYYIIKGCTVSRKLYKTMVTARRGKVAIVGKATTHGGGSGSFYKDFGTLPG